MPRLWLVLAVVGLVLGGCAVDEGSLAAGPSGPERFSLRSALAQVPASAVDDAGSSLQVSIADLDAAADRAGVERPADPTNTDEVVEFFAPLTSRPVDGDFGTMFVPLPAMFLSRAMFDIEGVVEEIGFSLSELQSFVALESPPAQFVVVEGVTARADLPEVAPGVQTLGEGEDFEVTGSSSALRPLGRPLRVAQRDGSVALSLATPPTIDWASGDVDETLADDPVLGPLASRLDEHGVVSALLLRSEGQSWIGVGLGWDADADGSRGVAVFAYPSAEDAGRALSDVEAGFDGESLLTRQPMSELIELRTIDVVDRQIVAEVRFPADRPPAVLYQMLIRGDGPFAD